jgi:hypothetical protein
VRTEPEKQAQKNTENGSGKESSVPVIKENKLSGKATRHSVT